MVQGPQRRELVSPSQVGSQLWMEITTPPGRVGDRPGQNPVAVLGQGQLVHAQCLELPIARPTHPDCPKWASGPMEAWGRSL